MRKKFKDLNVGEQFYPPLQNDKMDLRWQLEKVSSIMLTTAPPWEAILTTQAVITQKDHIFNAVVLKSIDGKTNGYYDYVLDETLVFVEGPSSAKGQYS